MRTLLATLLLAACATTSPPPPTGGPRGLHASDHLDLARRHEDIADRAARSPDVILGGPSGTTLLWMRAWNTSQEQQRIADAHRDKAAALELAYEQACGDRAVEDVAISPLAKYGIGGSNTATGVVLYLSPVAAGPDRLLADMKCHRAWMMLAPAGMEDCPLDLPGIQLEAVGDSDGITISIVTHDPSLVPELQRRAAHELESGAQLRGGPSK